MDPSSVGHIPLWFLLVIPEGSGLLMAFGGTYETGYVILLHSGVEMSTLRLAKLLLGNLLADKA